MADEKKRIIIGNEYADTFVSLYKLLLTRRLKDAGAEALEDDYGRQIIVTPTREYLLGDKEYIGESQTISMGEDGASWFAAVRQGKTFDDGSSEWKALIKNIAIRFHKAYSIIEYKRCGNDSAVDVKESEEGLRNVAERLFNMPNVTLCKGNKAKGTQDIYGAFVKLELGGSGQSCYTVMCKIYFRRTGKDIRPISSQEAALINAMLEKAPQNDEKFDNNVLSVPGETLGALEKLVNGKYNLKLKDCLCFSNRQTVNPVTNLEEDNYDLKTVKRLVANAVHNNAPIACTSIKVLSISHVKWTNDYYDIYFGNKPVLRAIIGFGGSLSFSCLNCGSREELIYSNAIDYTFTDEDGSKISRSVAIDPSKKDLGLDDETVNEIKRYSEISKHINKIVCQKVARTNSSCSAYVCSSQMVVDGAIEKCANCPYPEQIYTDYRQETPVRYFTSKLKFAVDKMGMVKEEEVSECECCGRPFTSSALKDGRCPLCADISDMSVEKKQAAKSAYGRYKNMLSHTIRLKHLFQEKYCLEDDTAVLFVLGTDRYVLSKLDLNKTGYINSPKRISRG